MALIDHKEPLNKITDTQYAETVVLHIDITEFIPNNELTLTSLIRYRQ